MTSLVSWIILSVLSTMLTGKSSNTSSNQMARRFQCRRKPRRSTSGMRSDAQIYCWCFQCVWASVTPSVFSCLRFSCRLYVNWRFLHGIEAQFLALQKGFNEVIPQHLLKSFDEKELEVKMKTAAKIKAFSLLTVGIQEPLAHQKALGFSVWWILAFSIILYIGTCLYIFGHF